MYHIFSYFRNLKHISGKRVIFILTFFVCSTCFAVDDSEIMQNIVSIMNVIFAMITALLTPAVILAGWLLTPDWTMGDFFGLRPYFLNVWILVSNLVYIAFAMILLFLAIMQIFGGEDAEYTFKKKLPQFLVGILMVPFTWLIVSWTLSFANQATAAVLAIPMGAIAQLESGDDNEDKGIFHDKVIPTKIDIFGTDQASSIDCTTAQVSANSKECISAAEFVKNNPSGPFFIMMIYAYDIFRIQSTDLIELSKPCSAEGVDAKGCIKKLTDVVIKFGTGLVVTFFFGVLTIALCWVLLMRAFKLWIYIMFSPLFGLAFFTGEGLKGPLHSEGGGGESSGMGSVSFAGFFKLAMVPVMVSAVLAFGLLFVGVINETFGPGHLKEESSGSFCTPVEGYLVQYCITPNGESAQGATSRLIIGNNSDGYAITFEFGNTFSGFLGDESVSVIKSGGEGLVDSMQSIFAHVILTLISLVIIWIGVKTAVQYDDVTRVAFSPFEKLGNSVGNFVQHLPSYIPTPHPAFKALTPGGAGIAAEAMTKLTETLDEKHIHAPAKSLGELLSSQGVREFNSRLSAAGDNLENVNNVLRDTPRSILTGANGLPKLVDRFANALEVAASKSTGAERESILKLARDLRENKESQSKINEILSTDAAKDTLSIAKTKDAGAAKVITTAENTLGSSSSASGSDSFKTHKINRTDGSITNSEGTPVTNTTHLTQNQRENIKKEFPTEAEIGTMDKARIKDKLEKLGFSDDELNKIDDDGTAINVAKNLLKAAQS